MLTNEAFKLRIPRKITEIQLQKQNIKLCKLEKKINFQKASLEQLKNVFHKKHQLFVHQPVINRYRCQNFPIERLAERVSKILDKAFQDAIDLQLKEFTTVTLQYRSKVGNEGVFSLRAYGTSFVDQLLVSIPL